MDRVAVESVRENAAELAACCQIFMGYFGGRHISIRVMERAKEAVSEHERLKAEKHGQTGTDTAKEVDGSDLSAKVLLGELVELFWAMRGTLEEMSGHLLRIRESQLSKEEMGALMLKAAHWSEPGRQYATDETYAVRAEELLGVCRERMRARAKEAAEAMAGLGATGECCYCGGGLYESDGYHAACVDCRSERAEGTAEKNIPPTPFRRGTDTDLVDDEEDRVDRIDRVDIGGGPVGNAAPTVAEG